MKKIILCIAVLALTLFALEKFVTHYNLRVKQIFPPEIRETFYPYYKISSIPDLVYEMNPNMVMVQDQEDNVPTNSLGFRDKEYVFSKPDNSIRIVALGDSICYGLGVNKRDSLWPQLTAQWLNSANSNHGICYEVINCGVIGYNLTQYYANLKEKALRYNPDLIVCSIFLDDWSPPYMPNIITAKFWNQLNRFFLMNSSLWKFLYYRLFWINARHPGILAINKDINFTYLKKMIALARERNIKILFIFQSTLSAKYNEHMYDEAKSILASEKIPSFDMHPYYIQSLHGSDIRALSINPPCQDPHPNRQANSIIAKALGEYLLQHKELLATKKWQPPVN